MSDERDGDEDREDAEQNDHDQRLHPVDEARADQADRRHRDHDDRGEDVVPGGPGVVADEERGRIAPEGDGDHRADDHDRREVPEPGRDPDQASVPEPLEQIRDQPARGRVAHAELDDVVAEQGCDDSGEQEREPDGGSRDRARLAEQREDAGADHRADAEEGCPADAHATIWSSWDVLLKRRPPSSVTVTMSSIRTPKRPVR